MNHILLADIDSQATATWWSTVGTWAGVLASVMIGLAAICGDKIRAWFYKPKFSIQCGTSGVFFQCFWDGKNLNNWFQIRLQIMNYGNRAAHDVEVHLLNLARRCNSDTSEQKVFIPTRLKWTHGGPISKPYIAPNTSALVDLGCLYSTTPNGGVVLRLNAELEGTNLWDFAGGSYDFDLAVVTSDGVHRRIEFDVSFDPQFTGAERSVGGPLFEKANFKITASREFECSAQ